VTHAILPPKHLFDYDVTMKEMDTAMLSVARQIKREFDSFVRTWNEKPVFDVKKEPGGYVIQAREGHAADVLAYVSEGTKQRHAILAPNFLPKTFVGQTYSAPGRGGVVFVSRNVIRPGIAPRDIEGQIASKFTDQVVANLVQKAIDKVYR